MSSKTLETNYIPQFDSVFSGGYRAYQVFIVILCLTINMLDGFDITAMAVSVNEIGSDMNLSADKLGLVFSFALAGMMGGSLFLAGLSDIFGRRRVIIASLFFMSITVFITGYATELWHLMTLRFLSGLAAGTMLASQAALASEYSPVKYRALSVAIVTAGYPLGAMMTGVVAGSIMPAYGWQGMFFAGGLTTFVIGVVAIFFMPESLHFLLAKKPPQYEEKSKVILSKLAVGETSDDFVKALEAEEFKENEDTSGTAKSGGPLQNMLSLLTETYRTRTLQLWSAFFMSIATLYFLMSWTPKLIGLMGYGTETANLGFTLLNFGGVIGIVSLGWLASIIPLSIIITVAMFAATLLMLLLTTVTGENLILVNIFFIGLLMQGGYTGLYAAATKIYPTSIRSTGVGWAIGLGRLGGVFSPALAGFLLATGVTVEINFYVFAIPLFLSGILAYFMKVK